MPQLTSQAAIIGVGRLLNIGASAMTLMVLARVMPDRESYGAICQLIVLYMVLSQVFAAGLPRSLYYFLPRYAEYERRGFLTQTIVLLTLSGLLMGIGLYAGAGAISHALRSPLLAPLLRAFALYPVFMLPTLAVEGALLHANRPAASVIFNTIVRVGMFGSLVIPVLLHFPLTTAVAIWVAEAGVMWVAALVLILSTVRGQTFVWRREMLREEWAFSMPLTIGTIIGAGSYYLDRFIVSNLYGTTVFGIYNNATVLLPSIGIVANTSAVVLMSELSKRTSIGAFDTVMPIWNNAMMKSAVLLFAALGFLAFWGHETMHILFSRRFAESGDIFSLYVWVIPAQLFIIQALFVAFGATRALIYVPLVGLALEVLLIWGGGLAFGLIGVVLGAVLARYLGVLYAAGWFVRHIAHVPWHTFMPWLKLGVALAIALLAGASSTLVQVIPLGRPPLIVVYGLGLLLFTGCYLLGLHLVRLLTYLVPQRFLPMRLRPNREVTT